ncbi:MAG: 4Fe-4S binding protein [Selenomonadaceae bacterium]|nr:4Fe-4S binding protein [Selenomonadaceae bacterium]
MSIDYKELKKGGFMRQKQRDCFSMRLKSVGGRFTAKELATVQKVAEDFGAGYIHLTSRQGIEIPFIKAQDINKVKETLTAGGVSVGVCGPRVRTITACQGNAVCPSGLIDTARLATEFDKRYGGKELPHKFKFGFTGCHNNCLKAEENDMGIKGGMFPRWQAEKCVYCGVCEATCAYGAVKVDKAAKKVTFDQEKCVYCGRCVQSCPTDAWQGEAGFVVSFGGLYGNRIAVGKNVLPLIFDENKLYALVDAALSFFETHAKPGERFRHTLDRVGWERFEQELQQSIA